MFIVLVSVLFVILNCHHNNNNNNNDNNNNNGLITASLQSSFTSVIELLIIANYKPQIFIGDLVIFIGDLDLCSHLYFYSSSRALVLVVIVVAPCPCLCSCFCTCF